jgi:hypothetical protein
MSAPFGAWPWIGGAWSHVSLEVRDHGAAARLGDEEHVLGL